MKERLLRVAKWVMYPAFYVACLALFGYLTFPFGLLKDRLIAEVARKGKPGQRLEIEKLSSYWFSGLEATNVKLVLPPDEPAPGAGFGYPSGGADFGSAAPASAPPKEMVIALDEVHVRVRILPLLIGRVRLDFWASAFGGEIRGVAPLAGSNHDINVELTQIDLGKVEPIAIKLGVPVKGIATGKASFTSEDGKTSTADGTLDLTIADLVVSDGKTKIAGLLELPAARLGTLTLTAEAKAGVLKVTKLAAQGADVELIGDGRITGSTTKDQINDAQADLYLRFKFTDAYRTKSDTTKTLLGDPTSTVPGLIEMQVPKMKKAKRADGFFGWHIYGPFKTLKYDPSTVDVAPPAAAGAAAAAKGGGKFKKSPGINMPFGASTANGKDDPGSAAPSPPPMMAPPTQPQRVQDDPIRMPSPPEPTPPPQPTPVEQPPPPPAPVPEQQAAPEGIQPAPAEQPAEVPR
jgi:type II secretion system protein N